MADAAEPQLHPITDADFLSDVHALVRRIAAEAWQPDFIVGIGRGGLVPGVYVSHALGITALSVDHSSKVAAFGTELLAKLAAKSADGVRLLFVDDINDSGGTIETIRGLLREYGCDAANIRFAVLLDNVRSQARVEYCARTIDRAQDKRWFVFPWEAVGTAEAIVAEAQSVPQRLA
ncbi:phosphoribosyltransferase [Sphingomonas sp. MMS24-J45]|uniref:phosphoribosyltransferase n=1 Tax=Sphingomonas sp. MMS24-J45 TaxID=3238806 RepID=UPI00384B8DEB